MDAGPESAEADPSDPIRAAEEALLLEDAETGPPAAPVSSAGTIFRMLLTLVLAAAAIYGAVYFIKRSSRRAEVRNPFLKILAGAHLGANRYVHIVAVGSKAWLVGAGEGGVNLIAEIEDKDILNAMFLEDSRKSAESAPGRFLDFRAMLRRLGAPVDSGVPVESGAPGADTIRKRRERLKGLR
ncbi:MAG: flagellar biosynthetic protein FliO [Treponema sp.]|nr:flagellar biosynthetic protein FliO [Treponema sp.]